MLLRRRCNALDVLTYFLVSACAVIFLLICTIVYGTRAESPQLPSLVKEFLPAGRCQCEYSTTFTCDTCLDCAAGQSPLGLTSNATTITTGPVKGNEEKEWSWEYKSDAQHYGLEDGQCQAAFPGLFEDVERARKHRRGKKVAERELSGFPLSKGMVRAMIFGGELYILQTHLVDNTNREKAIATLHSMHRALVASPSSPPNIEFILSVEDLPAQPNSPLWVLARRAQDHNLWLIPDFGFWSWDVPQIGTYSEVAAEAVERESWESWNDKQEKLVWRGKVTMAPKLRHALLDAARGKSWSDVGQVRWGTKDFKEAFLGPVDQCGWRFIAHAEGRSYSGALKYRQLCRSVVIAHKLQWIQHHHYLMSSSGPNQNFVEVERDFSNLDEVMQDLLKHPEKAKRIADNSVKVFRERYLTPAAEACYWRALWKGWRGVQGWEPNLYEEVGEVGRGKGRRVKRGVRFETFM
ncbi:glycosyl transferase family 90-domain-containing protein [Clohesyomyces aquaticus]|uniref:Glycosyl transferase family 90-domain-containing protein n=1 Tax=Clohesyomyces aquaticus TaxID=1231657 RepID=A0A1Y1ZNB9_9PLEO|nr:glycosyl transferase family 90-domain-containing protein [Clohesyomyces aquaticus]